jgi:hypothetical protein
VLESSDPRRTRSLLDLAGLKGQRLEVLLKRIERTEQADAPERVVWDLTEET